MSSLTEASVTQADSSPSTTRVVQYPSGSLTETTPASKRHQSYDDKCAMSSSSRPQIQSLHSDSEISTTGSDNGRLGSIYSFASSLPSGRQSVDASNVSLIGLRQSQANGNDAPITSRLRRLREPPSKQTSRNEQLKVKSQAKEALSLITQQFGVELSQLEASMTTIHWAVVQADETEVAKLLRKGSLFRADRDVDQVRYPLKCTPLHIAVGCGYLAIVKLLLEQGADVNFGDSNSFTPLHWASVTGNVGMVQLLLERNANVALRSKVGILPIHVAARLGHPELLHLFVVNGANVLQPTGHGHTALHLAAAAGNVSVVQELLQNGADVHARDHQSFTSLHHAATEGHTDIAEILLKAGSDPMARNFLDMCALHYAAKNGHVSTVELLIEAGTSLDIRAMNLTTPLHYAARGGHTETAHALLVAGAAPTAVDVQNRTALHHAAQHGHDMTVSELLAGEHVSGSLSVDPRDNVGNTPLHAAAAKPSTSVVRLLLDHGADINAITTQSQRTPLHLAAQAWSGQATVELLLARGADESIKDRNGRKPLELVKRHSVREALLDEWGIRPSFVGYT